MSEWKEIVVNVIKFVVTVLVDLIGFWFGYSYLWFAAGLPQESWALWICLGLALVSEYGYWRWMME